MSIDLLDKTRKVNKLLNEKKSSKVAFADVCKILGSLMETQVYVLSTKGKILGSFIYDEDHKIEGFQREKGKYISKKLNERFLNVLSTQENVNLVTMGFEKNLVKGIYALVTPITIGGERFGTVFMYRKSSNYDVEDIILCEYSTTVIGFEILHSEDEETKMEAIKKKSFSSAITVLTKKEREATAYLIHELMGDEGTLVTSKIAKNVGVARTVVVNALRKLESAGLLQTKSSGVKGTYIKVLNENILKEFENIYKEKWNS